MSDLTGLQMLTSAIVGIINGSVNRPPCTLPWGECSCDESNTGDALDHGYRQALAEMAEQVRAALTVQSDTEASR